MRRFASSGLVGLLLVFFTVAFLTSYEMKYRFTSSTVHHWFTNFSSESLMYMLGMENRHFVTVLPKESHPPSFSTIAFEFATSIKPGDIRSLLGRELPGFALYDAEIYVAGDGTDYTSLPIESAPPMEVLLEERKASLEQIEGHDEQRVKPPLLTTGGRKVAFVYHSHSSESFLPHLEGITNPNHAHHSKINITLVGKKLAEELEKRGIGAVSDETNVVAKLKEKGLNYASSYKISRDIAQSAMAKDNNLTYLFDIHRDAQRRDKTTVTINGKKYARIFFVIGKSHKNYEANLSFVNELNAIVEQKYPGLSRGIITKERTKGNNGVYNQDLSTRSVLVEVGGVDNEMEENYRAVEALAEAFSEFYWKAERVLK